MIPSLQKISDSIPDPSLRVRALFDQSVTPNDVDYKIRFIYASFAIGISTINTIGYGVVTITSRFVTACIYRDFKDFKKDCFQDASHVFNSLYFAAAMSAYLFMCIIPRSGYELYFDSYKLTPQYVAPILISKKPLVGFSAPECLIPKLKLKLHADRTQLEIGPIKNLSSLHTILDQRKDLVLIFAPDQTNAYLVKRDDTLVRSLVLDNTLICDDVSFAEAPIPSQPPHIISTPTNEPDSTIEAPIPSQPPHTISTPTNEPDSTILSCSSSQETVVEEHQESTPARDFSQSFHEYENSHTDSDLTASFFMVNSRIEESPPIPTLPTKPPVTIGAQLFSAMTSIINAFGKRHDHIAKEMKYRHILAHFYKVVTTRPGSGLYEKVYNLESKSKLKTQCLEIYKIIINPKSANIRRQYTDFIDALREAHSLLQMEKNDACINWIRFLAINRFAGIKLYGYCKSLVELASDPFVEPITLDNFWKLLDKRHQMIKNLPSDQGISTIALWWQQGTGQINWKDFLKGSNSPFIYGELKMGTHKTKILRHGTPIAPCGKKYSSAVTGDYEDFVDEAGKNNQNIFHVILEDTHKFTENIRVQLRLGLGSKPNFFPWAIRLDGVFIEPTDYKPQSIRDVKEKFSKQMYEKDKGYFVPEKLQKIGLSQDNFKKYMQSVEETFFKNHQQLDSLEKFQAFILLTYAEAILSLCKEHKFHYLEAHCKDDVDRGGALKAIIVLLHLYKTGKFKVGLENECSQALEELMVNFIAPPLIVGKKPIIEGRANFFKNVFNVVKSTVEDVARVPSNVYAGNFNTLSEPYQGITPIGGTCQSEDEYKESLSQLKGKEIVLKTTLDQLSGQQQLEYDIKDLNIHFNGTRLNLSDKETSAINSTIRSKLIDAGISNTSVDSVLYAISQILESDLVMSLQSLFINKKLGYIIPDSDKMQTDNSSGLYLTVENDKASIKLESLFCVKSTKDKKVIAKIRTTIEIPDHRLAGATVTTMVG